MAEKQLLHLIITRVDGPVFEGDVTYVTLPGKAGIMTILAGHEALISPLQEGLVTIQTDSGIETHKIENGMLEVSNNQATILI